MATANRRDVVQGTIRDSIKITSGVLQEYLASEDFESVESCISILKALKRVEWLARRERHHVSGFELH